MYLIEKQEIMKFARERFDKRNRFIGKFIDVKDIENLAFYQVEQKWIPCSERLPDEREIRYIASFTGGIIGFCEWTDREYYQWKHTHNWHWRKLDNSIPDDCEVLAWMPLPEPYKEVENGTDR